MPQFEKPSAVPIAMPRISPMAQPVRQCSVAEIATVVSARPEVGMWWVWAACMVPSSYPLWVYRMSDRYPIGGVVGGEAMHHLDARSHTQLAIHRVRCASTVFCVMNSRAAASRFDAPDAMISATCISCGVRSVDVIRAPRPDVLAGGLQLRLRPLGPCAGVESARRCRARCATARGPRAAVERAAAAPRSRAASARERLPPCLVPAEGLEEVRVEVLIVGHEATATRCGSPG